MKFIVDAQLPRRLCTWLNDAGYNAKHTLDLPLANRTSDNDIVDLAEREGRVVVTKDDDFVQSYLINGRPSKLLLIATGNINNIELEKIIRTNLKSIDDAFEENQFIEVNRDMIVIHE